jgi:hypothetical protein
MIFSPRLCIADGGHFGGPERTEKAVDVIEAEVLRERPEFLRRGIAGDLDAEVGGGAQETAAEGDLRPSGKRRQEEEGGE